MDAGAKKTEVFSDTNGLVAEFLDDIADRPVPRGAESTLAAIRHAVEAGTATTDMALKIIELFPNDERFIAGWDVAVKPDGSFFLTAAGAGIE